ncbi:SH3 domain-containing protein [Leptospira stimsonii]|uniref:SH3 domain-containing protein n=1 Tax=Leptospira stimsonii TaxID=2202203 RepID=A0ABY2N327_9LEPT|nr:SH3 domain-containing protein [Leptospira stimsonii]TGK22035.1 SH3 domain-containing protein [Leptospira stimsonii]TGM14879.1 SH3 domain-containing protein [Leptospira stimsonii]
MNFRRSISYFFIFIFSLNCKTPAEEQGYVIAANGLYLRADSNATSDKLLLIPRDELFMILGKNEVYETIENTKGTWWKIKYSDKIGWVFSGFARILDRSFYDRRYSLYEGDIRVKEEFYNELRSYFKKTGSNHCQLNFISDSFLSGDGDDVFYEVYSIEINTIIDTIALLSKYNSFSIRITDIKRNSEEIQIYYSSGNSEDRKIISTMKWSLDSKKKKFLSGWDKSNYRAYEKASYICNSHLKSWLYPFLK